MTGLEPAAPAPAIAAAVEVWTDGMGSFRARCQRCSWASVWFERASAAGSPEDRAVAAARTHGLAHAGADAAALGPGHHVPVP